MRSAATFGLIDRIWNNRFKNNMCNNKKFQEKVPSKVPCMSFKKLSNYFCDPDLKIQNLYATSAQQFTKDLDSVIDFSRTKLGQYGKIDNFSITVDSNSDGKGKFDYFIDSLQKHKNSKLYKILSRFFKYEDQSKTKVMVKSWSFKEFDNTDKFQVGKLYTMRPVSVTYNSTQQDYKYDKQIISEFCIEETNGTIKKLLIIDTIKNGKVKREKHIDGHKFNLPHYNFEIRCHQLNRNLMKTFLFHQINKDKQPEYDQNSALWHKKTVGINNVYYLQNKFNNAAAVDDHLQAKEIYKTKNDSIYVADEFNDLKIDNMLIHP